MRSPRLLATTATLLTLTLLAACGDGDGDDDSDSEEPGETVTVTEDPTGSTESTPPSETPTDTGTEAPMDPTASSDISQEQVDAALLTAAEVGPEFQDATWTNEDTPPPCDPDGTPVDEALPPSVEGGTQIDHVDGIASMEEEIAIYATETEAAEAAGLLTESLACGEGTLDDGTAFTLSAPQDVTAQVNTNGIGTSTAWEVTTDAFDGVLVLTVAGRVIIGSTFVTAPDTDTSALPDPVEVAASAYAKALAN